jgi:hypothetical protein
MPIYDFSYDFSQTPTANRPETPGQHMPGIQQLSDVIPPANGITIKKSGDTDLVTPRPFQSGSNEDIREHLIPGFRALDACFKEYFGGIKVPTKDSYRHLKWKVTEYDPTIAIWRDDLKNGKAVLPVGSISRTGWKWNDKKYSPPYLPMAVRYTSPRGHQAVLTYRPVPYLIEYVLTVYAEHKRDAEYIMYQICPRFNPLAEFVMNDGLVRGTVTLSGGGCTDVSDKEVSHTEHRLIKYEYAITADAWLPLPQRVVSTVMANVISVKDPAGNSLMTIPNR